MKKIYRNYLRLKGIISPNVMRKPFEKVYVPVDMIVNRSVSSVIKHLKIKQVLSSDVYLAGIILDGDWDLQKNRFDKHRIFIAFHERFIQNKKWEDTLYYQMFWEKVKSGKGKRIRSKSWEEYKKTFLIRWEKLYEDIKTSGYKSQAEIGGPPEKEIMVCISREGEIMRVPSGGGNHRFAMVKLLGIESIPVVVNVWHKKYVEKVKKSAGISNITPAEAIKPILKK